MKKNFLLLLWMTLLPLAGWAQTDLSEGWAIKFTHASPATYSGQNKLPAVALEKGGQNDITTGFNAVWTKAGEVVTEGITVGEYIVTVSGDMTHTYGDLATPTKKFYILMATPAVTTQAQLYSEAYDGQEHALVTTAPVYDFGVVQYSLDQQSWSTDIPKATKVGSYEVYVKVDGTENWNAVAPNSLGTAQITGTNLTAADITTAPVASQAANLVFKNAPLPLIDDTNAAVSENVKELQYKVGTGAWSTAIPTATDAGNYAVYYKAVGVDGYNDYEEATPINVIITAATPEVTAPTAATLTYTGEAQSLISAAGTATLGATVKYQVAFKAPGAQNYENYGVAAATAEAIDAGAYKVKAVVEDDNQNYNAAESDEVEVTIAQANAFTAAPTAKALTWNNEAQELITATPVKTGIVQYNVDGGVFSADIPTGTNAGAYVVKYKVTDSNYADYNEEKTVTNTKIAKKLLSVKVANREKTYDGTTNIAAATEDDFTFITRIANDGLDFSGLSFVATTKKDAGTYEGEVTVDVAALNVISTNYEYNIIPGTLTINPVEVTVTAHTGLQIIYGNNPNIATEWTISPLVGDEDAADVFATNPVLTTDAAATKPAIGTYSLAFTPGVLKKNGNYVVAENGYVIPAGANFKVVADGNAQIVITVMPQTHPYTGVAEDFSTMQEGVDYFVSGLMDDDEISGLTFARSDAETFDVGTYDLTASGATVTNAGKYPGGIVYSNSTLEIIPRELEATVNQQIVLKDADETALDQDAWSVTGLVNGETKDVLNATLTLTGSTASTGPVENGITLNLGAGANYTLKAGTNTGNLLVISATDLVLNASDADLASKIQTAAASNDDYNVTFIVDNLKGQEWYTLVLPFNVKTTELVSQLKDSENEPVFAIVNRFDVTNSSLGNIKFTMEWTEIPANEPFMIKTAADVDMSKVTFTGKKIYYAETPATDADADGNQFVGTYTAKNIIKDDFYYGWYDSWEQHAWRSPRNTAHKMEPMQAYIKYAPGTFENQAPVVTFEDLIDGATAIKSFSVEGGKAAAANAQGWYTINGVKLDSKPTEKGIYINNGKKVVIK